MRVFDCSGYCGPLYLPSLPVGSIFTYHGKRYELTGPSTFRLVPGRVRHEKPGRKPAQRRAA